MEEVEQSWTFEEIRGIRDVLLERFSMEEKQVGYRLNLLSDSISFSLFCATHLTVSVPVSPYSS